MTRAIVIGGSLGGLTAALVLRDQGWDVDVLERSPNPLEGRGTGIVVHPTTVRYLAERAGKSIGDIGVPARSLQYLGADGSLLAWECEAHDGLHTVEENAIIEQSPDSELILTSLTDRRRPTIRLVTSLAARLDSGACECGQPGPRLISITP